MSRLAEAAKNDDLPLVLRLIPVEAINGVDALHGRTALHWAAEHGNVSMGLALIKAGADINKKDNRDRTTPLMLAAYYSKEDFIILLLEQPNIDIAGALSEAVSGGTVDTVNLLLDSGADPNGEGVFSSLIRAVGRQFYNPAILKTLLEHSADVNWQDDQGDTVLMRAVLYSNIDAITQLSAAPGLDIDLQDNHGRTALFMAAVNGREAVVQPLINAGADPTIPDKDGHTPGYIAMPSISRMVKKYEKHYIAARASAKPEFAKRTMLARRMTTGTNFPPELQLPQKQLPQYIFGRSAYDELCTQLDKYNTKPQIQELARSLGITPGRLSKSALCKAIWEKLTL
jgi:ankyrin repeat protein